MIDGGAIGLKNVDEVRETFYFENSQMCTDFIEQIKLILTSWIAYQPKSEKQAVFEYLRRDHLLILCQASIKNRLGQQQKPVASLFHKQTSISSLNTFTES